jgi:hypothetical protein
MMTHIYLAVMEVVNFEKASWVYAHQGGRFRKVSNGD